jgi:hypothetical protein
MTVASEEVYALKRTRTFLRALLTGPRMPMKVLRAEAGSCLRHYPGDYAVGKRWADDVCEHGDRRFCRDCKESK